MEASHIAGGEHLKPVAGTVTSFSAARSPCFGPQPSFIDVLATMRAMRSIGSMPHE
jgi:hypothetical protein